MKQSDDRRFIKIRKQERISHTQVYNEHKLFEAGSWLEKPVKSIMDILPLFDAKNKIGVLDLGCGVGRNAIPIALFYKDKKCFIDCVDILEISIKQLINYSNLYNVDKQINGILSSVEEFWIEPNKYDIIIAATVLEHIETREKLLQKMNEIKLGLKKGGILCLLVNTNICESNIESGEILDPQFECLLSDEDFENMVRTIFDDFFILKSSVKHQEFIIPRDFFQVKLQSDVVNMVLQKKFN